MLFPAESFRILKSYIFVDIQRRNDSLHEYLNTVFYALKLKKHSKPLVCFFMEVVARNKESK